MEIDHVFASEAVVGRATMHSWGRPASRCTQSVGRPHSCMVPHPTTAPDAKTWSIPTTLHTWLHDNEVEQRADLGHKNRSHTILNRHLTLNCHRNALWWRSILTNCDKIEIYLYRVWEWVWHKNTSGPVFYLWLIRVLTDERRCHICDMFSHWLRPCSAIDRQQAQILKQHQVLCPIGPWMMTSRAAGPAPSAVTLIYPVLRKLLWWELCKDVYCDT